MSNVIIAISNILGFISFSFFIVNMYKGAMVLGVLKVFDKSKFISDDNEVIISERKKLKAIKENIIVSGIIICLVVFINIMN